MIYFPWLLISNNRSTSCKNHLLNMLDLLIKVCLRLSIFGLRSMVLNCMKGETWAVTRRHHACIPIQSAQNTYFVCFSIRHQRFFTLKDKFLIFWQTRHFSRFIVVIISVSLLVIFCARPELQLLQIDHHFWYCWMPYLLASEEQMWLDRASPTTRLARVRG